MEAEEGGLRCSLDNVQGLVDALMCIKWKKQQDAVCELSEYGLIIIVEELNCLQAKAYFRKELFQRYDFTAANRLRFGISLTVLVDCLAAFASSHGYGATALEMQYPGLDMQLLLKLIDVNRTCTDIEIRTRVPDSLPHDYSLSQEPRGSAPHSFAVRSAALKEAIDDLEWPGSSVQLRMQPHPPMVTFLGKGHGSLQIDFPYDQRSDLFIEFHCEQTATFWYKYKYLRAITANVPAAVVRDNRGSKLTVDAGGLLKVQHIVGLKPAAAAAAPFPPPPDGGPRAAADGVRTSYIEFFVMPDEELLEEEEERAAGGGGGGAEEYEYD